MLDALALLARHPLAVFADVNAVAAPADTAVVAQANGRKAEANPLFQRRIHAMDVVMVVQRVKEIGHFLVGRLAELGEVLGEVADLG